jgi:CRISPR-associated protein Cas2
MARLDLYIFCYDIARGRVRRRVAARLTEEAVRVQRSVFEARMTASTADRLSRSCACELEQGDSLRVYAIAETGIRACRSYGSTPPVSVGDYLLL